MYFSCAQNARIWSDDENGEDPLDDLDTCLPHASNVATAHLHDGLSSESGADEERGGRKRRRGPYGGYAQLNNLR